MSRHTASLALRLPRAMREACDRRAAEQERPVGDFVREAIERELARLDRTDRRRDELEPVGTKGE